MGEHQLQLITGDPYLCEQALVARETALRVIDPAIERYVSFADELDVSSLDIELRSCSLFALGRHFVIRKIEKNRSAKALAAVLGKPLPEGTHVTLLAGSLKSTNATLKAAKAIGSVIALPTPKGSALQRVARQILDESGLSLPGPSARTLLTKCGNDLLSLRNELDKLRMFAGASPIPDATAQKLCFNHTEVTVYPFYDRLGEGKLPVALAELDGLREDSGRIVGGIVRHFTRLVMVRLLLDQHQRQSEIASNMGMQEWLCKRLIGQAKRRSLDPLVTALRTGVKLDQRIKQGRIAPDDALMQLILAATGSIPG